MISRLYNLDITIIGFYKIKVQYVYNYICINKQIFYTLVKKVNYLTKWEIEKEKPRY